MMTRDQYIESLRSLKFNRYRFGEKVENVVDDPIVRPSLNSFAATYALAEDPQYEDLMTATSSLTGKKINRFTHIHQSTDDLVKKVKMQRLLGQKTAACFQRCVGMDAANAVFSTTFETDEACGTKYHENFVKFWTDVQNNDWGVDGAMTDVKGDTIRKAGPATAVEILGLTEVPEAGDEFHAMKNDKLAREIAEKRRAKLREEVLAKNSATTLEALFSQMAEGEVKDLNLIIKADVQGSVGALIQSLEKLQNENVRVKIIHSGVGTVNESDVTLASTSNAIIIGFNVRPSTAVTTMADREGVEIRTYRIIYEVLDDIEAAMKGMLDPVFKEVVLGKIEIRTTFKVPGVGTIGGAYVLEGKVQRNAQIRLVRDGIVVHEGKISSLKRFKDDAKEVAQGFECGIGIESYNDIKEGDIIEAFKMEEIERK